MSTASKSSFEVDSQSLGVIGRQHPLGCISASILTVEEEKEQEKNQKLLDSESNAILASLLATRRQAQAAKEAQTVTSSFSSSSTSSVHLNARFKKWQVQQKILLKNELLSAIAEEIPWKNVLELCHLKFLAAGELLWRQQQQQNNNSFPESSSSSTLSSHHLVKHDELSPQDIAFVLAGGLVLRHQPVSNILPIHNETQCDGTHPSSGVNPSVSAPKEHTLPVGDCVGAGVVEMGSPLLFDVQTARFKSIVLMFPKGKFKSLLRQLTPKTRAKVLASIHSIETKQLQALGVEVTPAFTLAAQSHQQNGQHPHQQKRHSSLILQQLSSTSTATTGGGEGAGGSNNSGAITWASLIVPHALEYEVDSSVLIVHGRKEIATDPSTTNPNAVIQGSGKMLNDKTLLSSKGWREMTKKNTQKRLDTIHLPQEVEAFPKNVIDATRAEEMEKNLWTKFLVATTTTEEEKQQTTSEKTGKMGGNDTHGSKKNKKNKKKERCSVVHIEKIGRLLKPIKKQEELTEDETRDLFLSLQKQTNIRNSQSQKSDSKISLTVGDSSSSSSSSNSINLICSRRTEILRSSHL
jgi:hypothetical protein